MRKPRNRARQVTLANVAAASGVSVATASRVFDPKWNDKIKDETRQAVMDAAGRLGYYGANALARGLQGNRTGIIALVVGRFTGYHYLEVTLRFIRDLQAVGKQVLVFEADPTRDMSTIYAQVHQYCVDAIIITGSATSDGIIDIFLETAIPVLVFGRTVKHSNISAVFCDEYLSAQKAADFLLESGHKTFGVITGNANISTANSRIEGFTNAVKRKGGQLVYTIDGNYTYQSGFACMETLLGTVRPDAVFCAEDSIAMGAIDAARELFGLAVPANISVMGFDDIQIGRFHAYNLTTMAFPLEQMTSASIEMIEALIEAPDTPIERVFDMELVVRGSVKAPLA